MSYFLYASFPNSRQKNRNPTVQAKTDQFYANTLDAAALTLASPANLDRTYCILKNLGEDFNFFYIYADLINFDPTIIPTFGVPEQAIYNLSTNKIYQKLTEGIGTDWVIKTIDQIGEQVEPFQSANLDSLENIWVATSAVSPSNPTLIGKDEGRG